MLRSMIESIKQIANFTTEFTDKISAHLRLVEIEQLTKRYPSLLNYSSYLDFMKLTGGAHIHNEKFSLGMIGFNGFLVPSFEEGVLDRERYFRFAEFQLNTEGKPEFVFAFDFESGYDKVFSSKIHESKYVEFAANFEAFLSAISTGTYQKTLLDLK